MKRGITILFCTLIFLNLISGAETSDTLLSPEEVSVIVDGEAPIIQISSPKNITYSNVNPILVNYTVIDITLDLVWYSLTYRNITSTLFNHTIYSYSSAMRPFFNSQWNFINNRINAGISGTFLFNLEDENYRLKIYANDSFNRISFSEVYFSINNSGDYCENGICNPNEDCSNCPQDCGECPSDTSSSGSNSIPSTTDTLPKNKSTQETKPSTPKEKTSETSQEPFQKIIELKKNPAIIIPGFITLLIAIIIFYLILKNRHQTKSKKGH